MPADSKKYFFIILALYFAVRIPLLFSNQLLSDELDIGAIAKEFVTKAPPLPIPLMDYVKRPYAMTSLFDAVFAAPFFLLFGDTLFALKLASLVWYIFPLIAWWFVWRSDFSPKKTFFILLFFALSPEMVFYSLTYGHQHLETMLWMALTLILYRRFLRGKLGGEVRGGLLLGLFGGLICSLSLANGVALVLLSLHLLFLKKTDIRKSLFFGIAVPAFLIGVSPLILYNLHHNMTGYFEMREIFSRVDTTPSHFFQRGVWVFSEGLPGLFVFKKFPVLPKFILTALFTSAYFFFFAALAWKKRKTLFTFQNAEGFDIVAFGITYPMLFILLALASHRIYGKELLFPMAPFIGMTLVTGVSLFSGALKTILKEKAKMGLALFSIAVWILGDLSLIRFKHWGEAFYIKGYSTMLLAQQLACRWSLNKDPDLFRKKFAIFLEGRTTEDKKRLTLAALSCLPKEASIQEAEEGPPPFQLGRKTVRKWLQISGDSFQPAGIINLLEQEEWHWIDSAALVDFPRPLSTEEKKWFNKGIEEESSLLVEDAFLRKRVLKKLLLP